MGVEDYLLTSTVNGILAQRLVRTLGPANRERYELPLYLVEELGLPGFKYQDSYEMYRPVPTEDMPTGYYGRMAILELLRMTDGLRRLVMQHATSGELQELAVTEGMRTMYQDGLLKCLAGVTTVEEVLRVTQES
jgi:general secretion pathway protein E